MTDSDAALVVRARAGDSSAFEALLRRYFRGAYLVAMAQLGERSDAEDACQDAFVRCWERLHECRDAERFGSWLLRTVRNTAHNYREHLTVRAGTPLTEAKALASRRTPETDLSRRELAATLRSALLQLEEIQREVVLLHDVEGLRHADVANLLDISELMSRRHLSDARKILRPLLQQNWSSREDNRD